MRLTLRNVLRNVIAVAFFVCVCIGGTSVCKADIEYGTFDLNTDYIGVTVSESPAFYKFTVSQDGLVEFSVQSYVYDVYFEVYNEDMTNTIISKDIYYASETSPITKGYSLALSAGTYCMKIRPANTSNSANFGKVRVKAAYTSYNANEVEKNDSFDTANTLSADTPITGTITNDNLSVDFYQFNVPKSGYISINFQSMISNGFRYTFYDADYTKLDSDVKGDGSETAPSTFTYIKYLEAGNYYLKIEHRWENTGRYTITYRNASVTSVAMDKSLSLSVNETYSLVPTVEPSNAVMKTLEFSSSKDEIASVDSNGLIRANKTGVVTITATTTDGTNLSAKTKVIVLPSQVKGLYTSEETITSSSIKLTWTAVSGVSGYRVYTYDSAKKKYVKYKDVTSNSVTIKSLKAETRYKFMVAAYVKDGSSYELGKESDVYSVYTAPKKLSATKITSAKVSSASYSTLGKYLTVKWNKVAGASGYYVYTKSGSGSWKIAATVENAKSTSTKLYVYKGYTYSIKVVPYRIKNGLVTEGKASKVVKKKV